MGEFSTALLGTVLGLVSAIVTSFIIPYAQKRMEKTEQRRSIHEKYAQPLAADAVNLLWRLDEILVKQRAQYLREDAPATPFNRYKRISTCYRIAAVLGWIRAIKLEQSYLFYGDQTSVDDLRAAVIELESALADSPHVEVHVLRQIAGLWNIPLPDKDEAVARIAASGNAEMQHLLSAYGLARYQDLASLADADQQEVVRRMAAAVTTALGRPPIANSVLVATQGEAMTFIGLKQAWIYRDWQQAIGSRMIHEISDAARRFDILDYGAFETLLSDPAAGEEQLWIGRLQAVVVGINPESPHPGDFRLAQLRNVAHAVASLVCAIERLDLDRKILDPQACALARRFLAETAPAGSP